MIASFERRFIFIKTRKTVGAEILNDRQKKAIYQSCRVTFELMGYER